jgi:NAD+ diphosphatase
MSFLWFSFFLNSSAAVTALIYNQKGELLFTHRGVEPSIGKLDLPGGFIDPGENAETAMMREIKEELDLTPDKIEYFASFPNEYHFSGTVVFTIDMVYKCSVSDFSTLTYRDDIIGLEFIKPEKVDFNEIPFKSVRNIIKAIRNE